MPTFSVTLETSPEQAEPSSADLWDLGAQGVEVRDGETQPMPGHAPPQGQAVLVGWFTDRDSAALAAEALGGRLGEVADQDWGESWKKDWRPISAGRVFVRPSWITAGAQVVSRVRSALNRASRTRAPPPAPAKSPAT